MSLIITLRNVSDLAPVSDYEYKVLVGDGGLQSRLVESGMVRGHTRTDGWIALIERLLKSRQVGESA